MKYASIGCPSRSAFPTILPTKRKKSRCVVPRAGSDCTTEAGLGWKAVPPSGVGAKRLRLGSNAPRATTEYHSRETPPASIPSSPTKVTESLARISVGVRMRSWWNESCICF